MGIMSVKGFLPSESPFGRKEENNEREREYREGEREKEDRLRLNLR